MREEQKDNLTGNLFNPDEKLGPGEEMDASGDVYNERGLVRENPSPEWLEAMKKVRKGHPGISEEDPMFKALARNYLYDIKKGSKKGE